MKKSVTWTALSINPLRVTLISQSFYQPLDFCVIFYSLHLVRTEMKRILQWAMSIRVLSEWTQNMKKAAKLTTNISVDLLSWPLISMLSASFPSMPCIFCNQSISESTDQRAYDGWTIACGNSIYRDITISTFGGSWSDLGRYWYSNRFLDERREKTMNAICSEKDAHLKYNYFAIDF